MTKAGFAPAFRFPRSRLPAAAALVPRKRFAGFEIPPHATPINAALAGDPAVVDIRGVGTRQSEYSLRGVLRKIIGAPSRLVKKAATTHAHRRGERHEGCHQKGSLGRARANSGARRDAGDRGRGILRALRRTSSRPTRIRLFRTRSAI